MKHDLIGMRPAALDHNRPGCAKCGRVDMQIDSHHIIERSAGGSDHPDNRVMLCVCCHKEWHSLQTTSPEVFETWSNTPPLMLLMALYHAKTDDDSDVEKCSLGAARRHVAYLHAIQRQAPWTGEHAYPVLAPFGIG